MYGTRLIVYVSLRLIVYVSLINCCCLQPEINKSLRTAREHKFIYLVSTNCSSTSSLHRQSIGYAFQHQTHPSTYKWVSGHHKIVICNYTTYNSALIKFNSPCFSWRLYNQCPQTTPVNPAYIDNQSDMLTSTINLIFLHTKRLSGHYKSCIWTIVLLIDRVFSGVY